MIRKVLEEMALMRDNAKSLLFILFVGVAAIFNTALAEPVGGDWGAASGFTPEKLVVQIYPMKKCFHGDLDIALADTVVHRGSYLQLSIEPLLPERAFEPVVQEIRFDRASLEFVRSLRHLGELMLKGPSVYTLRVPHIRGQILAGIFICRVPRVGTRCRGMDYANPSFSTIELEKAEDPEAVSPQGKIHYFKPVLLEGRGVFLPSSSEAVGAYWAGLDRMMPKSNILTQLAGEVKMDGVLDNFNIRVAQNYLQIPLPYEDTERSSCGSR